MGSINRYSERRAEPAFNFSRSNGFASSSRRMHRDVSPASHRSASSDRSEKPHIRICMIEESLGAAAGYAILIPSPTIWPVLTPERSTIRTISRLPVTFPSGHDPLESRDRPGLVVFRFLRPASTFVRSMWDFCQSLGRTHRNWNFFRRQASCPLRESTRSEKLQQNALSALADLAFAVTMVKEKEKDRKEIRSWQAGCLKQRRRVCLPTVFLPFSLSLFLSLSLSLCFVLILHSRPLPAMHLKRSQGFHGSDCCCLGNGSRWRKAEKMLIRLADQSLLHTPWSVVFLRVP